MIALPWMALLGLLTWAHGAYSSPWLIAHGSSAAFDMAVGLWAMLALGWCYVGLFLLIKVGDWQRGRPKKGGC